MGFLIFLFIFISVNFYIFIRGLQALPKDVIIQSVYIAVFLVFSLSFFVAFLLEGKIHPAIIAISENIGGFWMVTFSYFLLMVLLADIVRIADYFFKILPDVMRANFGQVKLYYLGAVVLILVVFSVIGYIRFSNPKTVPLHLELPGNGNATGNLTIVALSDVHLGDMIRKRRLKKYVELINKQQPDLILIAGDLFDRNMHTVERQNMQAELRKLNAKYGVYAILGNHEYFGDVSKAQQLIKDSGIKLLRDSAVIVDNKLAIIGRDDRTNRNRKPLKALMASVNSSLPTLLLDHQPFNLTEAVENNINIQISGHTHNGQIFPINKIVSRMYELAYGYKKIGNTHFYVSSGLGLWGAPIRLGTQSEIVNIRLNLLPR